MTPVRNVLGFHSLKCTLLHFRHAAAISFKPKKQQGKMGEKYLNSKLCNNIKVILIYIFHFCESKMGLSFSFKFCAKS